MRCAKLSLFLYPDGSAVRGGRGQRKIPVDLHFIVRLRHKASGAALGLSCAVCFEQPDADPKGLFSFLYRVS